MDNTYPLVPIANLFAFALPLVALISSGILQPWNIGIFMYAFWLSLSSLVQGINLIIWRNSTGDLAPAFCDFSTYVYAAASTGIPACSLAITRRLCKIVYLKRIFNEQHIFIDLFICLGLPLISLPLYYITQSARYEIIEQLGCSTTQSSGLSFIFGAVWMIILPTISVLFFCPKIILTIYRHRREVDGLLTNSDSLSSMKKGHFIRCMFLGCLDALVTLPMGVLSVYQMVIAGSQEAFWPGWSAMHNWPPIPKMAASEWQASFWGRFAIRFDQWSNVPLAFIFFFLFGFTLEARTYYSRCWWSIVGLFGFKKAAKPVQSDVRFVTCQSLQSSSGSLTTVTDSEDIEKAGELTNVQFNSFEESDEGVGVKHN